MFARQLKRAVPIARGVRKMSGCPQEAKKEMNSWVKYSYAMVAFTGVVGVYNIMVHDHDHVREGLPYNRIRTKPFPWHECPDCELLNSECWKKCRAENAGEEYTPPDSH